MKILSLSKTEQGYAVTCESDGNYLSGVLDKGGEFLELWRVPVKDYRNYEHFVGVMSKFVPTQQFLKTPIPVSHLTEQGLDLAYEEMGKQLAEGPRKND